MSSLKKKIELLFLCLILTSFAVLISCSDDEEGLANDVLSKAYNARSSVNEAPVAKADASLISGEAPLEVKFMSKSTDDRAIRGYAWDFGEGIDPSKKKSPLRTFEESGTYNVRLTVRDAEGLTSNDTVTITVTTSETTTTPGNESPIAVASANLLNGDAPLQVDFTGSNSSDDKEVVGYSWDFQGGSSTSPNTTHTFDSPGDYNVALTVTDGQGLQDTATLTITVDQAPTVNTGGGRIPCSVGGGRADETGAKIWCWDNVNVASGAPGDKTFANGQLKVGAECNPNQVTRAGDRLRFYLDPTAPAPQDWCNNDFNMRAEITTVPWKVNHPVGTEEWFGFSYSFGDDYIADAVNNWLFFQVHEGTVGQSPLISLQVNSNNSSFAKGEIRIVNAAQSGPDNSYYGTNVVPRAGQTVDVVVHVVWGDEGNGLLRVWLDGNKVHDRRGRTVRASNPVGGNAKFGIYKHGWRKSSAVQSSAQLGITHLETFMGALRTIIRRPGDADYGKDSYSQVAPD